MDGGAAFWYNTTTQRPTRPKTTSSSTTTYDASASSLTADSTTALLPVHTPLHATSIRPLFSKISKKSKAGRGQQRQQQQQQEEQQQQTSSVSRQSTTTTRRGSTSTSSGSRASHSSTSTYAPHLPNANVQAHLPPPPTSPTHHQLTSVRTNTSSNSDNPRPYTSPNTFTSPSQSDKLASNPSPGGIWISSGVVAVLDHRKAVPLTAEQKAEQKLNRERNVRERAAKKAVLKVGGKTGKGGPPATGHSYGDEKDYGGHGLGERDGRDRAGDKDRAGSISSNSLEQTLTGSSSAGVAGGRGSSNDPLSSLDMGPSHNRDHFHPAPSAHPFTTHHGRRYLRDPSLSYPLPVDLPELHRQTLRTMLLAQVFGGPICNPELRRRGRAPRKVLEVGCGSGYWSALAHEFWARRGEGGVRFVGIDIAPLGGVEVPGKSGRGHRRGKSRGGRDREDEEEDDDEEEDAKRAPVMSGFGKPEMHWRFVQHDLRRTPLPFAAEEFDLVMIKDLSLVTPTGSVQQAALMDEYLRILKPGGSLEIWESDHTIRMLLPHVPPSVKSKSKSKSKSATRNSNSHPARKPRSGSDSAASTSEEDEDETSSSEEDGDSDSSEEEEEELSEEDEALALAHATATYPITANTPLTAPHNEHLAQYNTWVTDGLERRKLTSMPCTHVSPMLLQEAEVLGGMGSRRLAVPLGEVRWEREGVGGAVSDGGAGGAGGDATGRVGAGKGKSLYSNSNSKGRGQRSDHHHHHGGEKGIGKTTLTAAQLALRQTALLTVVQGIEAMEPVLREVSKKGQDEWDRWVSGMMKDLVEGGGTGWGECLEVGGWWAVKRGGRGSGSGSGGGGGGNTRAGGRR